MCGSCCVLGCFSLVKYPGKGDCSMASEISNAPTRSMWSGKWAFILAAAASAVGLGNLWRFPYLAAKYGGGMFLLTYLVLVFTLGVSLLLLEITLGRKTRFSAINAFSSLDKRAKFIGVLASAVPFLITPYYCIIGGWVAKYLTASVFDGVGAISDGGGYFTTFITANSSFIFALVFIALACIVVALGVKGGIEKANLVMMPLLLVMALGLAIFTLTMPGAMEGAAYYLLPDFSKFCPELVIAAMGQVFFSLSLAMGIMITYGSYLGSKTNLTQAVTRIGCFDIGVSFLAGLMIVPAAFIAFGSGEAVAENSGPSLMFIALPQVFDAMGDIGGIIAIVFFVLVLFAALTSAISLLETCVSIVQDGLGKGRREAMVITFTFVAVMAVFVNLGYNGLSFIQPLGEGSTLLDTFDFISNSVMMPVVALLTCLFVGWVVKPKTLIDEIKTSSKFVLEKAWTVMIKYIAPVLVVVILIAYVAAQFGMFSM